MNFSLIITTFNRAAVLENSLKRLEMLTKPDEIIIVDDGSGDHTKEIAQKFNCEYIYHDNPDWDCCSIPRNIGIKKARYENIVIAEPEVLFITDIIGQLRERDLDKYIYIDGVVYLEGKNVPSFSDREIADPIEYINKIGYADSNYLTSVDQLFTKCQGLLTPYISATSKKNLINIGGWDEQMSFVNGGGGWGFDDIDLLTRLRENGINCIVDPELKVVHQWHERPPFEFKDSKGNIRDVANSWKFNEKIFLSKAYPQDIVANKEKK